MQIENIRHIGIVVQDLQTSLAFYQDLLGFRIQRRMKEKGAFIDKILGFGDVEVTTLKMKIPGNQVMIELLHYHHPRQSGENIPRKVNAVGIGHIALTVANIFDVYQQLSAVGVEFISPPQLAPDQSVRVAFCQAPEGTYIELVEQING